MLLQYSSRKDLISLGYCLKLKRADRIAIPLQVMKIRFELALLLLFFCRLGFAQDAVASLEGEIRDTSGGVVMSASVGITNLDTGYQQAQATSQEGLYKFSLV